MDFCLMTRHACPRLFFEWIFIQLSVKLFSFSVKFNPFCLFYSCRVPWTRANCSSAMSMRQRQKMDGALIQWTNDWWWERGERENDKLFDVNGLTERINYRKAARIRATFGFNQRISFRSRRQINDSVQFFADLAEVRTSGRQEIMLNLGPTKSHKT
jgi:hypothetical protein